MMLIAKLQTENKASGIFNMSIFQISFILQLLLFNVNGADRNLSTYTTQHHDDNSSNVTGINRIVGGSPASIKDFPFMSSEDHWIPNNPYLFIVVVGTATLRYTPTWQVQRIEHIMIHNRFNPRSLSSDIALLRIRRPFRITPYVNYAPLPEKYDPDMINRYKNRAECTVAGWGKTEFGSRDNPKILQYAKIPIIPKPICSRYLGYQNLLFEHICGGFEEGEVDACQGDSGGPLLCGGVQVGIISWGLNCAAPRAPGVYVRIDVYLQWINHTIMRSDGSSTISNKLALITSLTLVCILDIQLNY